MYSALIVFHRWLALITGAILILIALSGSVLVFEGPIAAANVTHVAPGARALSLDSLGARAVSFIGSGDVIGVAPGRAADEAFVIAVGSDTTERDLLVNPYSGQVLGPAPGPSYLQLLVRRVHLFHTSLLGGSIGEGVVAFVTLASLVLVLTGLIVWWRDRLWRINWSASWKRIVFDIHHALGVFAALVLLIVTGTGVWMGYKHQIDPLVLALNSTATPTGPPKLLPPVPGTKPISLDSVAALAHSAIPDAQILLMDLPEKSPVVLALRHPEDHTPGGRSRVAIDRFRGTVLRAANTRTAQAGTRLMNIQRPLHTGDILGPLGQIIWFLAAWILASQAVTGTTMWWNGRAARKSAARRATPSVA